MPSCNPKGNETVPIQLAKCWLPGLAISSAKISIDFSNKIHVSNFIKQHWETVVVWNQQDADCSFKTYCVIYYNFRHTIVPYIVIIVHTTLTLIKQWWEYLQASFNLSSIRIKLAVNSGGRHGGSALCWLRVELSSSRLASNVCHKVLTTDRNPATLLSVRLNSTHVLHG